LICGRLDDVPVVVMDGRCHFYEGYSLAQLMLPIFVLRALGIRRLVLSNASGALNPRFAAGDVVVIEDHINLLFWGHPARRQAAAGAASGPPTGAAARGSQAAQVAVPRGGQAACVYDRELVARALEIARRQDFVAHRGVYVGVTGPNYETRAEYRFLRRIGGDVVGMSTIPEAVAAARCGLRTLALSIVTNVARPDQTQVVLAEDVVQAARCAEPHLRSIVRGVLSG
jgi:purine-nucleoside phosphorylase